MGLFDVIKRNATVLADARSRIGKMSQQVADAIRHIFSVKWSYPARRDSVAYLELFHTTPRLDPVDIIATDCANATYKVFLKSDLRAGKEDAEPIGDHPIFDLLENPIPSRPDFDGFTLRYLTHVWLELQGDAYWIVVKDRSNMPRELYPIPSNWVISTPTESVPYFLVMPQGNTASQSLLIQPDCVIWFKNPNVVQPYARGRGRAEAIGDEIESDEYASKYAKNFFFNDATPRAIVTAPGQSQTTAQQMKEAWNQQYQGIANAQKMGFLNWDAKLLQLSTNQKEMDFIQTRAMFRDMTNSHWQMPPELMGIIENSNRATIQAAYYLYAKNVLTKRLMRFDSHITRQLMPMWDSKYALKCDDIVPDDQEFALQSAQELFSGGIITRGEARIKVGMKKLGTPADDEYLVPLNIVPTSINEISPGKSDIETPADQELGTDNAVLSPEEPQVAEDEPIIYQDIPKSLAKKGFSKDQREKIWHQFDKAASSNEYPYKKAVKKIADSQQKEFNKAFEDAIGKGNSPTEAIDTAAGEVFGAEADTQVKNALYSSWMESMKSGHEMANDVGGINISYSVVQPAFKSWIEAHGLEKSKSINDTSKDQLRSSLAQGIDDGESIRDLQGRINSVYDDMRGYRSEMIARTESASSLNFGSLATYKSGGMPYKTWISMQDDRTREDHAIADGQTVPIDENFDVGSDGLMYPGDPSGSADEVINCRCTFAGSKGEEE